MMRHHFPDLFLGTAPRGLTTKLGSGGDWKGPRVSASRYESMTCGQTSAEWRLGEERGQ